MSSQIKHIYEFGPFRLDTAERLLSRDGAAVALTPRVFELLRVLVERRGHLLEKDELLKLVWSDAIVEESNLSANISILRKALGENGQRFIETAPKHGYRFVAAVHEVVAESEMRETSARAEPVRQQPEPLASRLNLAGWTSWRWLALALSVLLVITGSIAAWRDSARPAPGKAAIKSLAVLPFKPLTSESRDEALELGLAETLITRLSSLRRLTVRPMSAVRKYTGAEQNPLAAGREQQVEAVLESHFQRAGDRLRVTVQFLSVRDGRPLWAEKFDEQFTDILAVEDRISARVAGALALELTGEEQQQLNKRYTANLEAYQLYLRGRFYWNQ